MVKLKEAALLVDLARTTILSNFRKTKSIERIASNFKERQGVFVTLHSWPGKDLRGCIGLPYPIMSLGKAVIEASYASAFQDPRFFPLKEGELDNLIIEISVLSKPELIECKKEDLPKHIKIGKDGLMCTNRVHCGLLLPQVAVEQKWGSNHFLEQVCVKAGLSPDEWRRNHCKIYKFKAQIFVEVKPNGKVIEKKL